jgi:hypothetical protein
LCLDNSAIFYIGANNEYDLHIVQVGSDVYKTDYEDQTPAIYDNITANAWLRMYDTAFVSYGTLILAVDEYRSEINNNTSTGKPPGWPIMDTNTTIAWNAGAVSWNLTGLLTKELSDRSILNSLTDTSPTSKDWIRIDSISNETAGDQEKENDSGPPKFAHVQHAFVKRVDATVSKIQASLTFLVIVFVCNAVKLFIMLWVIFMEHKHYIVTLGDGAASFLEYRDPTTERMCMLSKPEITGGVAASSFRQSDHLERIVMDSTMTWTERSITYSNLRNRDREVSTLFL